MAIWFYVAGVIVALISFALVIYYHHKRMTVGGLAMAILCPLLSWGAVLAAIFAALVYFVDWDKELWRKKE